jgi:hypothetical protein
MNKWLYNDGYSKIGFDEVVPCVVQVLTGTARNNEHYQQATGLSLEVLKEKSVEFNKLHVLLDGSQAGPITSSDIDYFRNSILPDMYSRGVRYVAFVPPEKKISGIILAEMFRNITFKNLTIKQFTDFSSARKWLKKLDIY